MLATPGYDVWLSTDSFVVSVRFPTYTVPGRACIIAIAQGDRGPSTATPLCRQQQHTGIPCIFQPRTKLSYGLSFSYRRSQPSGL